MPIELALDRGYDGCFLVVHELTDGQSSRAVSEYYTETGGLPGCDATAVFTPVPLLDTAPKDVPQDDDTAPARVVVVGFVDGPPLEMWDHNMVEFEGRIPSDQVGRIGWAGPFLRTIPGTDSYCDELW